MTCATRAEFMAAEVPTGPAPVSIWQVLRGPRADPLERWTRIAREHGAVARYRLGLGQRYFVSTAEGAKRVLQENAANYVKQHAIYSLLRRLFGNGLFTSNGDFWLRQRRLAQPAFHRERLAAMGAQMVAAATATAHGWEAKAASGAAVSMFREMTVLALKVVGDALFGTALSDEAAVVGQAWDTLNTQLAERAARMWFVPPILPTRYDGDFRRARRSVNAVVASLIAARRKAAAPSADLLSMLVEARDADDGAQMTDAQLRDEVMTMLFAGHETTATALAWTWALLAQHPEAERKLQGELDRVLAGRAPCAGDFVQLPFTRAVIDESMRLHPPAYILIRRAVADDVVCGKRIRKGGVVVMSPLVLHRNPLYWERPDDFVPERWLDAEAERRRPRFAWVPFGGGPRQCIGNSFAMMEAVLILATLAQRFSPRLADGYVLRPEYLVLARPAQGAPMILRKRDAPANVKSPRR